MRLLFSTSYNLQLKSSSKYAKFVCSECSTDIEHFSVLRRKLISIQNQLYKLEGEDVEDDPKLLNQPYVRLERCSKPVEVTEAATIFEPVLIKCEPTATEKEVQNDLKAEEESEFDDEFAGFSGCEMDLSDKEPGDFDSPDSKDTLDRRKVQDEVEAEIFQCNNCDYTASKKSMMTKHKRTIHGRKGPKIKKVGP